MALNHKLPRSRHRAPTVSTLGGEAIDSRPRRLAEGSIPPPLPGLPPMARLKPAGPPPLPADARDRTRYRARTVAWFREGDALTGGATSILDYTAEVPAIGNGFSTRALAICFLGLAIAALAVLAI